MTGPGLTDATRRVRQWAGATALVAAVLCVVASLPWLLHAPATPSPRYVAGQSLGMSVLVGYPTLLFAVLVVGVWLHQRGTPASKVPALRWLVWLLFVAMIVGLALALYLMFGT